jgi:hypothetical protein
VIELSKLHMKHEAFACAALKAMCSLASLNLVLREELGKVGACEYIMDIIPLHQNPFILQDACETIMHLSYNPSNTTMLGDCGACEVLIGAFRGTLAEIELGMEVCSGGMLNMATYGIAAKQNRFRLIDAGAVPALQHALAKQILSLRAKQSIMQLLQILGSDDALAGTASADGTRRRSRPPSGNNLVGIIHGSEMKGDTVPLQVEVRETVELVPGTPSGEGRSGGSVSSRTTETRPARRPGSTPATPATPSTTGPEAAEDEYLSDEGFHNNSTHEI